MPAATPAKAPTRIAGPDKPTHLNHKHAQHRDQSGSNIGLRGFLGKQKAQEDACHGKRRQSRGHRKKRPEDNAKSVGKSPCCLAQEIDCRRLRHPPLPELKRPKFTANDSSVTVAPNRKERGLGVSWQKRESEAPYNS